MIFENYFKLHCPKGLCNSAPFFIQLPILIIIIIINIISTVQYYNLLKKAMVFPFN